MANSTDKMKGRAAPYPARERATKASMRSKQIEAKSARVSKGAAPATLGPRGSAGTVRASSFGPITNASPRSTAAAVASNANIPRVNKAGKPNYIGKGDITHSAAKAATAKTKRAMKKTLKANAPGVQKTAAAAARAPAGSVVGKVIKGAVRGMASMTGPAQSIAESAQKQQKREEARDFRKATGTPDA